MYKSSYKFRQLYTNRWLHHLTKKSILKKDFYVKQENFIPSVKNLMELFSRCFFALKFQSISYELVEMDKIRDEKDVN